MTEFTAQQQAAIETIDKNVAVSAGAGSGKTRVLVERFMYILAQGLYNKQKYVDAGEIVAITFTRKAAGEMKERIRKAMAQKLELDVSGYWHNQLQALERAQIATIHSLCSRILRENPVEAQLDPGFTMAEEFEGDEFIEQYLQGFLRQELTKDNAAVKKLLEVYGVSGFSNMLSALLPKLQELLAVDLALPYAESAKALAKEKESFRQLVEELVSKREEYTSAKTKGREKLENLAAAEKQILEQLEQEPPTAQLYMEVMDRISLRGAGKEAHAEAKAIAAMLELRSADKLALELLPAWKKILVELDTYIMQKKQELDFLTFDDLENLAVELLLQNEQVRHKYQNKFRYIMVDEFQDTNDRQRQLIYLLCGDSAEVLGGKKLFIVGDPKQSIYRFRGADVSVFARVRREIKESGGEYLTMSKNFRSVDKVLATCNEAFKKLLGEDKTKDVFFEALDFNKESELLPTLMRVEYCKEDKSIKRVLEAEAVAEKIKALHSEGMAFKDMAILLRAMTHCDILTEALQRHQLPYVVVDGRGFYKRQEVLDILNLLAAINNKYRNLELAGALRSPLFGIKDTVLTELFINLPKRGSLIDELTQFMEKEYSFAKTDVMALERAAGIIGRLRSCAALNGLPELWRCLWQELSLDIGLSMQEHGANKLANVKKLGRLALEYSKNKQATLGDWLEYVDKLRAAEVRETAANLNGENAVQIMTIHKSKGLEFKTVFLPMLDGGKSQSDRDSIKFISEVGLGIKVLLPDDTLADTSILQKAKEMDKELENAERVRQLYVAMTRAEENLIMSGVVEQGKEIGKADADKSLHERNWLDQLQQIFAESSAVELEAVDMTGGLPVPVQKESVDDDGYMPEEGQEAELEPLPLYKNSGRRRFNASALQTYLYCQRQYYYQQLLGLPELEHSEGCIGGGVPAYVTGLIVHKALELYRGDAHAAFATAVREEAPGTEADYAYELFTKYIESELYSSLPRERRRELQFSCPMDGCQGDECLLLSGVIDCLGVEADGALSLVDYKTGTPPAAGDTNLGYAYQLAIYKAAAERLTGRRVRTASLHFLQSLQAWELPADYDYLQEAVELCHEISAKSEEKDFACALSRCATCPYAYVCNRE